MTDAPIPSHCDEHGHIWIEADGSRYTRHRDRTPGLVRVTCAHCPATAELQRFARHVAPPMSAGIGPVLMR